MQVLITVVHVITCFFIILIVLMYSGKGAEISSNFAGSSQTIFGSAGGANFFTRLTSILAAVFMATSVLLTIAGKQARQSVFQSLDPTSITPPEETPKTPNPTGTPIEKESQHPSSPLPSSPTPTATN